MSLEHHLEGVCLKNITVLGINGIDEQLNIIAGQIPNVILCQSLIHCVPGPNPSQGGGFLRAAVPVTNQEIQITAVQG